MLFSCSVGYRANTSELLFGRFLSWTLAITLHSKQRRLVAPRSAAELLSTQLPVPTRKNPSLAPTIPYEPVPERRRRSDASCRTKPLAARHWESVPFVGGRSKRRARTSPTAPERSSVSLAPTTAFGSQIPTAGAPLEK